MQPAAGAARSGSYAVACLYFLSGLTGLVYEVTFSKYLSYVFGVTAYASSAVLLAFMGGLSAGAVLVARWDAQIERRFMWYGVAEILVGCFCALSPWLFAAIGKAYVVMARSLPASVPALVMVRWLVATSIVVVPAAGMGATLPLLAPAVSGRTDDRWVSRLYALNVLGGAGGSLLAAYLIVPALGLATTMRAAAVVNFAIGAAAIALGRQGRVETSSTMSRSRSEYDLAPPGAANDESAQTRRASRFVLALGSGLLVFAAEVVYVHMLALVIGTSVYAFGLMLAIFLVCLGVGAAAAPSIAARTGFAAPIAAAVAGLALAATTPIWDRLPPLFDAMAPFATTWAVLEVVRGLVAFVALAAPAVAMGTLFPTVLREIATRSDVGAEVGKLTALNTLGSIAGSVCGGFLLLPLLGSQTSMLVIAGGYAALALATAWTGASGAARPRKYERAIVAGTCFATLVLAVAMPRWDLARLTSGANVYFGLGPPPDSIEMAREDVFGGVTTVARRADVLTLYTNGKFQGDNGPELRDQRAFAHIPSLLAEHYGRAFLIGLGTGTTAGTLAAYPFERIDVAEISPAIVHAAAMFFSDINGSVLTDPRFRLLLEDGRHALLVSGERYDLIGIQIPSIWFAGAANLYNREFYELARARLEPGGVLQQWVQLHHIRRRELASVLATVRSVFAHVALYAHGHQGIIVAADKALSMSRSRADTLASRPSVAALLQGASLAALAGDLLLIDESLDGFVSDSANEAQIPVSALVSTDDNLYLEYATPKNNISRVPSIFQTIDMLIRYRPHDLTMRHLQP
jgi:spermidine synthase